MSRRYPTKQSDRLDKICEKRYGKYDSPVLQFVIDANPGIENLGLVLPAGMIIELPPLPVTTAKFETPIITQIRLWD